MNNINHLLKITVAWTSIVYVVCFVGVAMFPGIRGGFMMYGFHMGGYVAANVLTLGTFIYGLIIWNVVALLAVWLFAALYNGIKK